MSVASRSGSWRAPYWTQRWAIYSWRFKEGQIRELKHGSWRCEMCGRPGRLELHHRVSVRLGGEMYPDDPRLLHVLCRRDHIRVEREARARRRPESRRPESDRPAWAAAVAELRDTRQ